MNCGAFFLPVPFGSVVRLAEHFAVGAVGCAALAPCGYVVGVHFGEFPDFVFVCVFRHGTVWAVGSSCRLSLGCLHRIDALLGSVIEHADIQKFFILFATQDIFENSLAVFDEISRISTVRTRAKAHKNVYR